MLRIAVVDDELAMREQLCGYVRQYAEENHLAVEVVPFADGAAFAMRDETGGDISQRVVGLYSVSVIVMLLFFFLVDAVICHTKTDSFVVKSSLQNAEKLLQKHGFARCNKCYLVNLRHVQGIQGDAVRVDDVELELSRRQKAAFTQAMLEYVGEIR